MKGITAVLIVAAFFCVCINLGWAQTSASGQDWEDINFVYNSSELVDGFPSMLRMADLLSSNPGYRIELKGYADSSGGVEYNKTLSQKRAEAVANFLKKYGAADNQVQAIGVGKVAEGNETPEGRFQNRHVEVTLRDGQGSIITEGSAPEVITEFESCCENVAGKLDDIAASINSLKDQPTTARPEDLTRIEQKLDAAILAQSQPAPAALTEQDIERIVKKTIEFNKSPEEVAYAGKRSFPWWEKVIWKGVDFGLNIGANLITNRPIIDRLDKIQNNQVAALTQLTLGQQNILAGQTTLSQQMATGFEDVLSGQGALGLQLDEGILSLLAGQEGLLAGQAGILAGQEDILAGQEDLGQQIGGVQVGVDENGSALEGIYGKLENMPQCRRVTRQNPFGGEYSYIVCE
jgi:hypothetical protein